MDGETITGGVAPGTYAEIRRAWKAGSKVRLQLGMAPQLIESHPLVEETRNHAAIKRGPVVYCLESSDLPKGTRLADIRIPADVKLKPRFAANLLEGVAVLEGTFAARPPGDWEGRLYRELNKTRSTPVSTRLIPYYSWANRGRSEMSVWLPLD